MVLVKNLIGQSYQISIGIQESVLRFKEIISQATGSNVDAQRLIFNGNQLQDDRTLKSYNIQEISTIFLVYRLRGDIGMMIRQQNAPFASMIQSEINKVSPNQINDMINALGGQIEEQYTQHRLSIDNDKLLNIINYADKEYQKAIKEHGQMHLADFKIYLRDQQLQKMIHHQAYEELINIFGQCVDKIVIRRCAAVGKILDFHTDQSLKTLQLCLNDGSQYEGGELIYAFQGKLVRSLRQTGIVTVHNNRIVHGVTKLVRGVRYGLFLLKKK